MNLSYRAPPQILVHLSSWYQILSKPIIPMHFADSCCPTHPPVEKTLRIKLAKSKGDYLTADSALVLHCHNFISTHPIRCIASCSGTDSSDSSLKYFFVHSICVTWNTCILTWRLMHKIRKINKQQKINLKICKKIASIPLFLRGVWLSPAL